MTQIDILRFEERISVGVEIGESHFREFKSACARDPNGELTTGRDIKALCKDIAEALVSFANADGGELLVGVEDDGTITGVPHRKKLVELMKSAYREYVHRDTPLPIPVIGDVVIEGKRVLYFSVTQSGDSVHLTSDGRCLRRFDRENRPVAPEKIVADRAQTSSREYDRAFVDGVSSADLDLELLTYVADRIAPGFSPEKLLQYLGLAEYGEVGLRYRKATVLLFAKEIQRWYPRCEVRIVRIRGTELGTGRDYNVIDDDRITESIPKLIDDAWDALRPYLARTRFQSTGLFSESLIYPEAACREALVNAIAHRDYSREGSAIEVLVYDDRMEFRSPGGLLTGVSIEELMSLARVHETRNALIARTLRELGHMREMGEGILRMFGAMRESELVDPELNADMHHFGVTLRSQSIFNRQDIEWLESYKEFDLEKNEQRVVLLGRDGHLLSTNEIINVTGIVDIDDFRALWEQLRRKGIGYNARPRAGGGGRRRELGRFRIRPSREAEQFLAELIQALGHIGPATMLSSDSRATVRSKLSPSSPYRERPDFSLQALGFMDTQRRFLPKALSYVPELEQSSPMTPQSLLGRIKLVKPGRYGFITDDEGIDYFFHVSGIRDFVEWEKLEPNMRVSFRLGPSRVLGRLDVAYDIRFV